MNEYNISVPIFEQENMRYLLYSCLQDGIINYGKSVKGYNTEISRHQKTGNYRKPRNGSLTIQEFCNNDTKYTIKVIKYYLLKCYNFLRDNHCDFNKPVKYYIKEFHSSKLTGKELVTVYNLSNEQLLSIEKGDKDNNIQDFLSVLKDERITDVDGFESSFLYDDLLLDDENERRYSNFFNGSISSKRIYLNPPRDSEVTFQFGLAFIKKCIDRKIPFKMKLFGAYGPTGGNEEANDDIVDGMVIYARNAYFKEYIEIIEEIFTETPDYKKFFGSPIATGGNIIEEDGKSYMAITHNGRVAMSNVTYNDAVNKIIHYTYCYACCKMLYFGYEPFDIRMIGLPLFKQIKGILSKPIDAQVIKELETIAIKVRPSVASIREKIKNSNSVESFDQKLCNYIYSYLPYFKSLVTFGDLEHLDVPIYMDKSFESLERQNRKRR